MTGDALRVPSYTHTPPWPPVRTDDRVPPGVVLFVGDRVLTDDGVYEVTGSSDGLRPPDLGAAAHQAYVAARTAAYADLMGAVVLDLFLQAELRKAFNHRLDEALFYGHGTFVGPCGILPAAEVATRGTWVTG